MLPENMHEESSLPTTSIFDTIALSMSGGGFRAAAYGLGTLKALDQLGLLDSIQILSSISGGTITAAFYALQRKRGQPFSKIYDDLYRLLASDEILPKALENWRKSISSSDGNYKLIHSFADAYDELLYDHKLFGEFWESTADSSSLQSIIFGTTELYSGLAFRFQYANLPTETFTDAYNHDRETYFIGNGNVHIRRERARQLRLADVVAASSCFPVGFEPIVLPDDFLPNGALDLVFFSGNNNRLTIERLALVDGGVYDNQGIEGLLLADQRNQRYKESPQGKKKAKEGIEMPVPTTLYLIADVASAELNIYDAPELGPKLQNEKSFGEWFKLTTNLKWGLVAIIIALLLAQGGNRHGGNFIFGLLAGLSLAGFGLVLAVRWIWLTLQEKLRNFSQELYTQAMPPIRMLTIKQFVYLLKGRLSSLLALLLSVFLRRVRSLNYGLVYNNEDDDEIKESESYAVMSSIIGSILKDYEKPYHRVRLQKVVETVRTASQMGTTLWWLKDKSRMDTIIDSAQVTLAWRIILYFERLELKAEKAKQTLKLSVKDQDVYNRALIIWSKYQ